MTSPCRAHGSTPPACGHLPLQGRHGEPRTRWCEPKKSRPERGVSAHSPWRTQVTRGIGDSKPRLDKRTAHGYNNSEEQTTHTVSSSKSCEFVAKPRNCRHFCGVAADFLSCCVFAFLEVFRTIIVTVYFPMWKVRRIRISTLPHCHFRACFATARQWRGCGKGALSSSATGSDNAPFPPSGWMEPTACVCMFTLHRPRSGVFILHNMTRFVNGICLCFTALNLSQYRRAMANTGDARRAAGRPRGSPLR